MNKKVKIEHNNYTDGSDVLVLSPRHHLEQPVARDDHHDIDRENDQDAKHVLTLVSLREAKQSKNQDSTYLK